MKEAMQQAKILQRLWMLYIKECWKTGGGAYSVTSFGQKGEIRNEKKQIVYRWFYNTLYTCFSCHVSIPGCQNRNHEFF